MRDRVFGIAVGGLPVPPPAAPHHRFNMTLDARVGERTRVARDLHDTLLQSAHGLLLRFQTVSQLLPDRPMEAKELDSAIDQTADFITKPG